MSRPSSRRNSVNAASAPTPTKQQQPNSASEELFALQQQDGAELAYTVQRERSDRMYVERLFAVREEHHARSRMYQQEIHERELVATASTFAHTLRLEAERHRSEMEALRQTLEKKNGIGSLQRDVRFGLHTLSAEQDALSQLATAAEAHENQMKTAMTSEKVAWEGEKTQLLRRIGDLEMAIQASREGKPQPGPHNDHDALHKTTEQEKENAENALRRADEAWASAKNHGLNQSNAAGGTPSSSNQNRSSFVGGTTPPPEFRLTPLPSTLVSLDAVEKARQRTTALLDQLSQPGSDQ